MAGTLALFDDFTSLATTTAGDVSTSESSQAVSLDEDGECELALLVGIVEELSDSRDREM